MDSTMKELIALQPDTIHFLKKSIEKKRISHALLFEGGKGTGKKATSIFLAKALFCLQSVDGLVPCETCHNCRRIEQLNHPDVYFVKPDGMSIKKEQIKILHEEFQKKSVESRKKVYIISDVEKMTTAAANSLLKFLEEPYEGTTIMLLTTQQHQILPTIISRCQVVSFKPLNTVKISSELVAQGISASRSLLIANLTNHLEEGIALGKDDWFAQAQKIVLKLAEELHNPFSSILIIQEQWLTHFKEKSQHDLGLVLLLYFYRDLLWLKLGQKESLLNKEIEKIWESKVTHLSEQKLAKKMLYILEAHRKLTANTSPQLLLEQLIINLQEEFSFV